MDNKPFISSAKLKQYVSENSSYSLYIKDDQVELRFTPNTPEAMAHFPEGEQVEHVMTGIERNGNIYFYKFITRSSFGETVTDLDGEDDPVMLWLQYI
ncbi:MAG: hypothetical protein AAE977_02475 [Thermoplasmataceae archaeon]|jgi:hypothetical protein